MILNSVVIKLNRHQRLSNVYFHSLLCFGLEKMHVVRRGCLTGTSAFFTENNKDWDYFVQEQGKRWRDHVSGWIIAGKHNPFHIIRYEDLKNDTVKELKKILDFLGFLHISEADIEERLGDGYNSFYRNHKDDFGHYTEEQKSYVHQQVQETINALREHGKEAVFPIHEYL